MKQAIKSTLAVVAGFASIVSGAIVSTPSLVNAYAPERPEYTIKEINTMYKNYLNGKKDNIWEPSKIVFNSISDSVIGHEFNFVGARDCTLQANGRCNKLPEGKYWEDSIPVKDGETYIIRLYAHNNNPYGMTEEEKAKATKQQIANSDAGTAENVKVAFTVPSDSSNEVEVNGFIRTTSGEIPTYLDSVKFTSSTEKFHLEYVYGSALLENNGIGKDGGYKLSDDVVNTKDGTLIGYDKLDGRVPGCYQFANYVSIQVKAVFDYDFTIEKEVRLADSEDKSWHKAVEAKVGDKVEFLIGYYNDSKFTQGEVAIRDYLPKNLKYVEGSTVLRNSNHVSGVTMNSNNIANGGIRIGSYGAGANAYVTFTAEVVDNSLECGANSLINYAQGGVGSTVKEDHATVHVTKTENCEVPPKDDDPTPEEPKEDKPTNLPSTGPEAIAGGIIAAGSVATAAGYYVASRRQLRK